MSRRAVVESLLRSGQSSGNGSPSGCLPPSPRQMKLGDNQSGDQFVPIGKYYVNRQLKQSLGKKVDEHKGGPAAHKSPKANNSKWQESETLKEEDENARSTSPRQPKQALNIKADPPGKTSRKKKPILELSPNGGQTPLILRALFEDDADDSNPSAWLNTNASQVQVLEAKNTPRRLQIAGIEAAKKTVNF